MIDITQKGSDVFVFQISIPEVHTLDVPDLKEKIQQLIINNNIKKLVLDLSKVENITSTGIGIFLNINENLKSKFRLANPSPGVKKVLELTKVTSVIKVFDTVGEALANF